MWMISPSGIGLGDAKLALLLGAALGPGVLPALVAAFVLGGFGGAWLLLHHGAGARGLAIPFGAVPRGGCGIRRDRGSMALGLRARIAPDAAKSRCR